MRIVICIAIFSITMLSCKQKTIVDQSLRDCYGKKVSLEMFKSVIQNYSHINIADLRKNYKFISLVYLQNDCAPCYDKFIEWHIKMDSIGYRDNYTTLFIVRGKSYEDFIANVFNIKFIDSKFYVVMDPNFKFLDQNQEIPFWIIDNSILIDENNRVQMVGFPFYSNKMTKKFNQICSDE